MVCLRSLLIIMSPLARYTRLKFHYDHHHNDLHDGDDDDDNDDEDEGVKGNNQKDVFQKVTKNFQVFENVYVNECFL